VVALACSLQRAILYLFRLTLSTPEAVLIVAPELPKPMMLLPPPRTCVAD
jgi:hypothetical protein